MGMAAAEGSFFTDATALPYRLWEALFPLLNMSQFFFSVTDFMQGGGLIEFWYHSRDDALFSFRLKQNGELSRASGCQLFFVILLFRQKVWT